VYLGQFDKDFKRLVRWVAVCSEGKNAQADVWIQSAAGKAPTPHKGNPLAGIRPPVAAEKSWPGSHEQLLYVWRHAAADNRVLDANGATVRRCVASMHGLARPTHNHAADVTGGTLRLEALGELLAKTARRNGEFTLEMVAIPRDGWCGRERVVFAMADREQQNLVISQHRDRLLLRLRTSKTDANAAPLTIGKVHRARKAEVAVTFADGVVRVFFSGKPAGSKRLGGDLSDWKAAPVVCGSQGGKSWAGSAAAIAVSSHARDVGDIKQRWELLQGRKWWRTQEPARLVVGAKLVAKSARPAVDQLGEYNRALAVDAYEVEKVLRGRLGAKRILVSRWVVLDRKKLDDAQAVGKSYKLTVEKLSAHPYLKMESSSNTLDEFDTPEFYNVALPAAAN
jgi:hypothetical protein